MYNTIIFPLKWGSYGARLHERFIQVL